MAKCIEKAEDHCKSYPRCYGCNAYTEPTNADRIRAMSDEVLSVWLMRLHTICECCSAKEECDTIENDEVCRQRVLEWLQQPVEEDDYD